MEESIIEHTLRHCIVDESRRDVDSSLGITKRGQASSICCICTATVALVPSKRWDVEGAIDSDKLREIAS